MFQATQFNLALVLSFVIEIVQPQAFMCVNRSLIPYDFRGGARAMVNIA